MSTIQKGFRFSPFPLKWKMVKIYKTDVFYWIFFRHTNSAGRSFLLMLTCYGDGKSCVLAEILWTISHQGSSHYVNRKYQFNM